jgi:stage II sporulation protein D
MDAPEQFWIRILLFNNIENCTLKINSPFNVRNARTENMLVRFDKTGKIINVKFSADRINIAGVPLIPDQIIIEPDSPHTFNINGKDYRGKLNLIKNPDANSFDAINIIPLEPYLAGVVGAEMPNYWEPAALEVQAVAARTYCLYIKQNFGKNRNWDVKNTQANQAYNGIAAESSKIWQAVNNTAGMVLTFNDGRNNGIFPTYYSSTCGGHTENSASVFGGDSIEPLEGIECPFCKSTAKPSCFSWKNFKIDKKTAIEKLVNRYPALAKLGRIEQITPLDKSVYNDFTRITTIQIVDANGKNDWLRAEDFRLTIDPTGFKLKSTACSIIDANDKLNFVSGRGFGHSVGMCQYGTQAQARQGKNAQQILLYYYPGSSFKNLY